MNKETQTAILVVSFGTSVSQARALTLDAIESDIRLSYPETAVYRAWTSGFLRKQLLEREHTAIDGVTEAMNRMKKDGISEVIVQPVYVARGAEYERMKAEADQFLPAFSSIRFGAPLLSGNKDIDPVIDAVISEFGIPAPRDMLVLMGHGASRDSDRIYADLALRLQKRGYENIFLGTLKGRPAIDELLELACHRKPETVFLAPFMISAGGHALRDLAGNGESSWRTRFERAGFSVRPILKGLGQSPAVRQIFLDHIAEAAACGTSDTRSL